MSLLRSSWLPQETKLFLKDPIIELVLVHYNQASTSKIKWLKPWYLPLSSDISKSPRKAWSLSGKIWLISPCSSWSVWRRYWRTPSAQTLSNKVRLSSSSAKSASCIPDVKSLLGVFETDCFHMNRVEVGLHFENKSARIWIRGLSHDSKTNSEIP